LISSFESFDLTLPTGHLPGEQVHLTSTEAIDFRQVLIQFTGQEQTGKQDQHVLLQIPFSHSPILAYGFGLDHR
jgi:hypothetical protein